MSYDYALLNLRRSVASPAELEPSDTIALGSREEVRTRLSQALPGLTWDEGSRGSFRAGSWLEIWLGDDAAEVRSIAVRCSVRHDTHHLIEQICDATGWAAFDAQTMVAYGRQLTARADSAGVARWVPFH